jgi:hypothetical protein
MSDEPPLVLASAGRHNVRAEDALHAWAFAGAEWHDDVALVHAMPARKKFLNKLRES